jgi:hypothetical protein
MYPSMQGFTHASRRVLDETQVSAARDVAMWR